MEKSYLLKTCAMIASAVRFIFNPRRGAAPAALAIALALAGQAAIAPPAYAQTGETAVVAARVNINTADEQALSSGLVGVGQSRAREIVRYREAFGPFSSVDELTEVKGINTATLDKNRAVITLE